MGGRWASVGDGRGLPVDRIDHRADQSRTRPPAGPWRSIEQLEFALFEYLDWWNLRRLHGEIGMIPPAEKETAYRLRHEQPAGDPRGVTTM